MNIVFISTPTFSSVFSARILPVQMGRVPGVRGGGWKWILHLLQVSLSRSYQMCVWHQRTYTD